MDKPSSHIYDILGIGIGPSNLSTACLLHRFKEISCLFVDGKKEFSWHEGMLLKESTIQVSFIKDLVTLVDPQNPFSFLSFLHSKKRLYRFLACEFQSVSRREFNEYYHWAASQLQNLLFNQRVREVRFEKDRFVLESGDDVFMSRHLLLGTGLTPSIPSQVKPFLGEKVFHTNEFMRGNRNFKGKRVTVLGGGQSGAEIILELLRDMEDCPLQINWVSSRFNFLPLDDFAFSNEYFFPNYCDYFYQLPFEQRNRLLKEQKLISDGINKDLLAKIYRRLYEVEFHSGQERSYALYPGHRLIDFEGRENECRMVLRCNINGTVRELDADYVILATGYKYQLPDMLAPLAGQLHFDDGRLIFGNDFSISWDGHPNNKIFIQNASREDHGIADPNLSLISWRSAVIINSLLEKQVYDTSHVSSVFNWEANTILNKRHAES